MMQPLAIWLTCVCRPTQCMVASNYVPRRLGLCWSCVPGLLPVSAASPSMDHEHGAVSRPIIEYQIRLSAPSSVISRPTCFSSSLGCCWQVGSAPFFRRRLHIFRVTYLLTYLLTYHMTNNDQIWHANPCGEGLMSRSAMPQSNWVRAQRSPFWGTPLLTPILFKLEFCMVAHMRERRVSRIPAMVPNLTGAWPVLLYLWTQYQCPRP